MSTASFTIKATDATKSAFDSVNKRLHGMTGALTGLNSKIGALVGVGGFGTLIGISMKSADALGDHAQMLGINSEALAKLNYAAELNGSSQEAMSKALSESVKRLGEAATGSGDAGKMIQQLGLNINELKTLSPDKLFTVYADKISQLGTKAEQMTAISKLMGDESKSMLNVIEGGAPALAAAAKEAEAFGYALSAADTAKIQAAMDSFTRVQAVLKGVGNTIAAQLAPYLEAFARWFADAAVKHNGFKDEIIDGIKSIVETVAFMADMWRVVEIAIKGVEITIWALATATNSVLSLVETSINGYIEMANLFGANLKPLTTFRDLTEASIEGTKRAAAEFKALADAPLPTANVKAFFDDLEQSAQRAAEKTAQATSAGGGTISLKNEQAEREAELQRKRDEQELERVREQQERINAAHYEAFERLRESQISENEQLRLHYEEKELIIEEAFQNSWIAEQERKTMLEQLEIEHQAKLGDIMAQAALERRKFEKLNAREKTKIVLGEMAALTEGVAQENRAMFEINKAAAIANAVISTYEGVTRTLGSYPWPIAGVMAALHLAAGMAKVSAISSTSFGAKTAPSLGGTGANDTVATVSALPTDTTDQQRSSGSTVQVIIQGNLIGNEQFVNDVLLPGIRDAVDNRDEVLFSQNSRQARELSTV